MGVPRARANSQISEVYEQKTQTKITDTNNVLKTWKRAEEEKNKYNANIQQNVHLTTPKVVEPRFVNKTKENTLLYAKKNE